MLWFSLLVAGVSARAQQSCPPVQINPPDLRADIFNGQQEMDAGDAIAEQVQREFLVIDDEDYTGYVQRVGSRLLEHAPQTDLRIQFFLFDLPLANAMSLPGGRIYVSRKLVALAKNEDQLAGILGHELGHVLTKQPAINLSQLFRDALGVTQPGSREEIFKRYQDLQDSVVRKHKVFQRMGVENKQEEMVADQIGMQLMANSGYNAQALPEIFDRIAETKGKTGNWLSDLFGTKSTESKRLREMLKQSPTFACSAPAVALSADQFQKWRAAVVAYSGLGHKEQVKGVFQKLSLNPPLQSDLSRLHFSPDGKFLLAQNESTVFVLDSAAFLPKFSIYAPSAYPARFTPDSEAVVFHNPNLRVEKWSVADEARISTDEVVISSGCLESLLSPDGRFLVCLSPEFDLTLYETETSSQVFQKKHFLKPEIAADYLILFARLGGQSVLPVRIRFSPDGNVLVVSSTEAEPLAVSLETLRPVPLLGSVRKLLSADFDFVGNDKIVGVNFGDRKTSGVMTFPSGKWVQKIAFGNQSLESASNPRYAMLRPISDRALGLLDLETGKFVFSSERAAGDIVGDRYVYERLDGDVGMIDIQKRDLDIKRLKLPLGQLGELEAASASPDLHWLALSTKSRGAEWDLLHNQRVFYVRGFKGAVVEKDGTADVDIYKFEKVTRHLVRLNPSARATTDVMDMDKAEGKQFGPVFLRTTRHSKEDWKWRDVLIEGLDVKSGSVLWSREFPKDAPETMSHRSEGLLVYSWNAKSEGAKLEIRNQPAAQRWTKVEADNEDYFLEVVEPLTGKILGTCLVRTGKGSFQLTSAESSGNVLVAADSSNRLHVFSIGSGEQKGILFGSKPALSNEAEWLAAENERGQLTLYDLGSLERAEHYTFTHPIVYNCFGADRKRLLVVTGDQAVYFLKLPEHQKASANSQMY